MFLMQLMAYATKQTSSLRSQSMPLKLRTSTPTRMLKRSRSVLEKRNGSRSWASMQDFVQDCFEFGATLK